MRGVPFVVIANKQDLPHAQSPAQIIDTLALRDLGRGRKWHVQAACATNGDGVYEAMDALGRLVKERT